MAHPVATLRALEQLRLLVEFASQNARRCCTLPSVSTVLPPAGNLGIQPSGGRQSRTYRSVRLDGVETLPLRVCQIASRDLTCQRFPDRWSQR